MGAEHSRDVGTARELLEAVRANSVNEKLGVRRCSSWKVFLRGRRRAEELALLDDFLAGGGGQRAAERDRERAIARQAALEHEAGPCTIRERSARPLALPEPLDSEEKARDPRDFEDSELTVLFADQEEGILCALAEAFGENSTVERLFVQTLHFTARVALALARTLARNSTLRSVSVEVESDVGWTKEEQPAITAAMVEALRHNTCLLSLRLVQGVSFAEGRVDLGDEVDKALECNRHAFALARELGQTCRLDASHTGLGDWASVPFRFLLLAHFLAPAGRLPANLEACLYGGRRPLGGLRRA